MARAKKASPIRQATTYTHPDSPTPMRPEVGTQAQFKKKKPPQTYRYDSSLSPALEWDGQNPAREQGEKHIAEIVGQALRLAKLATEAKNKDMAAGAAALQSAAGKLKALSKPFLNWAGNAERVSFDVPTLPLFVHERLSTKAIIETLQGHKSDKQDDFMANLFADPRHSVTDQVLRAYEYKDNWVNRLILGDSLVAMNSLLHYEALGGQVQMIYMDPPYGVKFGSNFQPFVRKRDVSHGDDEDMTREPEMVQAYRDTWELGLHSYLTYMRDRLLLSRELLAPSGSIFVQISDENLHHVRELMDEVFGAENFVAVIPFRKKTMPLGTNFIEQMSDYLLWYAKQAYDSAGKRVAKYRRLYCDRSVEGEFHHCWYELPDGSRHKMSKHQLYDHALLPPGARVYRLKSLEPSGPMESGMFDYEFEGTVYHPPKNGWGTTREGMDRLVQARRIQTEGNRLTFIIYADEGTASQLTAPWSDTVGADDKEYVVQTNTEVVKRCRLMTTDPGDLVVDPTCGSGTTAYVAEQWGRRWITMDTSRVPLALARQRLLTATFPYYALKDEARGPAGGFVYKRKQNAKGEEVGGIVPHVTLKSIANNEPPAEEVLVDRPETVNSLVRVSGPFAVEATIPLPADFDTAACHSERSEESPSSCGNNRDPSTSLRSAQDDNFQDRMLEVLRKSPVLRLEGNRTVTLTHLRPPAKTLSLSAEAVVEEVGSDRRADRSPASTTNGGAPGGRALTVAFVFGPENGAVSEKLVYEAAREAHAKSYTHLYVIGFAIQPNARELVEKSAEVIGVPATYVQATPDLMMGDLLKNMRSSQIFSVCGLPEIRINRQDAKDAKNGRKYQVELLGLDVFDPVSMEAEHRAGNDVPCWMLDSDYSGLCFRATQVFFPRTSAWENLKKALKSSYEETVWDHLAGTLSAPFAAGTHGQVAVKVIDDRGNELLVVKSLKEVK